jgi:hypothetical protein
MDNSEERVHEILSEGVTEQTIGKTTGETTGETTDETTGETTGETTKNLIDHDEPSLSEMSTEEKFIVLAGNKPIKYLDKHENAISILVSSIKNAILSFTMIMSMSISTVLNKLVQTEFGQSIIEKGVNIVLMCERATYRIRKQFDISFNCPPFNIEIFRPTINATITIYDSKLKSYVSKLEAKDT